MSRVFHDIEKRIIRALRDAPKMSPEELGSATALSPDQVRRGIEWLRLKGLADVSQVEQTLVGLGENGRDAHAHGLPERRLLGLLADGPRQIQALQQDLKQAFGSAMGIVRKNRWVRTDGATIEVTSPPEVLPGEGVISQLASGAIAAEDVADQEDLKMLGRRPDFIKTEIVRSKKVSLLPEALKVEIDDTAGAIDVEAPAPQVYPARTHPLRDVIEEIREIFVTLGFAEIVGNLCQPSFWNFDALFTPQDHPAREMQDTFYLKDISAGRVASAKQMRAVSSIHQKKWRYRWDPKEAQRMVLRTHTTCVTVGYLAEHRPKQARIFSLGPVFRNEKVSYKHLAEFNQIEGIVVGPNATLRDLMGIQREFYRRLGLDRVKFWPTFFPYTEPSLQTMVYNEKLDKWVELFGMGIFRPEVTRPLGITERVLAWGGGIERIAMLKYDIDDLRQLYGNDLGFLRGAVRCR